ncbi:MAG: hypothetical protein ABIR47_00625 [Candidatus Kapaibacterium sp.]
MKDPKYPYDDGRGTIVENGHPAMPARALFSIISSIPWTQGSFVD